MAAQIEAILGIEEASNLRSDFNELITSDDCNFGEVEDLHGLRPRNGLSGPTHVVRRDAL